MNFPPKKAEVYAVTKLPEDNGFGEFAVDVEVGTKIFIEDVNAPDEDDSTDEYFLVQIAVCDEVGDYEEIGQELDAAEWRRFCELYGLVESIKNN